MIEIHGPDESRGHISIRTGGDVLATACDMGPHLDLWTFRGVRLTPASARDLARALDAWADRDHTPALRDDEDTAFLEASEGAA